LLLYYPQQKMIISQKRMQEIQPKIEALKVQYKWDQAKLGQELMALYSKEKINPFGSLWFLFIQLPILLVVYNIIRYIQTPVNEYYLYWFSGNFSVANINFNFYWLDLLSNWWIQWIILAIAVAWLQFLQIKISLPKKRDSASNTQWHNKVVLEKKENWKDYSKVGPNPEMMNKIMLYLMPIMVLYFTYSLFAALGLYWGISTLFMLIQNLIVNKIFKK
jgi:YidC/Oxa1 family membrane protein insertase